MTGALFIGPIIRSRKTIPGIIFFICFSLTGLLLKSQTTIVTDSPFIKGTTVVYPGLEYKRSGYHNFFWGKHYRKEWTTPVRAQNFFIDTAEGGLTVIKENGSRQTHGLRLKDSSGKQYVLRSIDKDFGRAFPDNYQGTFITHIAKDQASISHPFAAITITPMIEASGIYHTIPKIVFVPEQEALGQYNKKYGNQLYLFEERPDENQEDADNFGNSENLIGSERLFEHIYGDNDNHVDQYAFAKARLFDMFIGDWGRHPDNWRWAKFEKGETNIYKPVPRDRDQTYSKFDGLWPWIATNIAGATWLESFDYKIHKIKRFNKPGWPLDRPFTNELTEEDWIKAAKELQNALTNSVIEYSVRQMPPQIFAISGNTIIAKLKSRRDQLQEYAQDYYRFLSHHVDVRGSNKRELFEIKRSDNGNTQVNIYKITKKNKIEKDPYYSRAFYYNQTREVRLYSLDKTDIVRVTGPPVGVKVRIIDPEGADSISMESKGRTKLSVGKKFMFDTLHTKKFNFFILPLFSPREYKVFESDPGKWFTKTGVRISVNMRYIPQPWRKEKYLHVHLLSVDYGVLRTSLNMGYVGKFGHAVGPFDFLIKARYDARSIQNYFGTGNESPNIISKRNYYRTISTRMYGGWGLSAKINRHQSLDFSVFCQNVKLQNTDGNFVSEFYGIDTSLFSTKHFAGAEAVYHFHHTNSEIFPTSGVDFIFAADYVHDINRGNRSFSNYMSALSLYLPLGKSFSLAARAGGAALIGDADFYHLNKLDGHENLRGYERERFYGKTMFYNNNELRWVTDTKNYFFNGQIGLLVFYDIGRIWQPLEKSNTWHSGYGAGLILIPFNKIALTGTYGTSTDGNFILLKAGMFF